MSKDDWFPIVLTFALLTGAILLAAKLDETKVSAFGSIIAATGSVIAILWFTIGLRKETAQQKIQNQQFRNSFGKILEQGRREALLLAKSILNNAETQVVNQDMPESIKNLLNGFLQPFDYDTLYQSRDAETVSAYAQEWIDRMGPGYQMMRSIKSAATVYLKSIDAKDIDYGKDPEQFVYLYGPYFWNQPFFEDYRVVGEMLSNFQYHIKPGSRGIALAALCAQAIKNGLPLENDKMKEDIAELIDTKKVVPEIVFELFPELKQ